MSPAQSLRPQRNCIEKWAITKEDPNTPSP